MRVILRDALGADSAGFNDPTAIHSGSGISLLVFTSHCERLEGYFSGTICLAATQQVFGPDAQVHQRSPTQQHGC